MQHRVGGKIKVLHLRATNFYGGPERQIHRHALAARSTDFEIQIGSFSEQGGRPALLDIAEQDGVPTKCFEVASAYDRRSAALVRDYLRTQQIAILATHDYRTNILGRMIVKGTDTRWVAFSRGWTRENFRIRLYHALDKFILRFADHIVAVAGGQRDKLRRLGIPGRKITVVHNAILPESFDAIEPIDLKARFGFPPDSLIGIAGGRFSTEKGQGYLVDAAAAVIQRNPQVRFVLFGDGPDFEAIRSRIAKLGLSEQIVCPGFEKNLAGCLKSADLLVNPSLSEGLPNIVLEAMAMYVPVVATAVGGVPELVTNNESGLLVRATDVSGLTEAIMRLVDDASLRQSMAQEAYRVVTESFSFEQQCEKLVQVYRGVLAGKAGRT